MRGQLENELEIFPLRGILRPGQIGNASGVWDTTFDELQELFDSAADFVVTKSITLDAREGNPPPRLAVMGRDTLNSVGLPNLGADAYEELLPQLERHGKPLVVSISYSPTAGGTLEEQYGELSRRLGRYADVLEVNASCPNLGLEIAANDPRKVGRITGAVNYRGPVLVKVPPYNNIPGTFEAVARALEGRADGVTTINSLARCMYIDPVTERSAIAPNGGYGGFGGPSVLPLALAEVNRWHRRGFTVVGVGGIGSGTAAYQHVLAGARAVQVGSALLAESPGIFARIKCELEGLLSEKGVTDIGSKVGAVQNAYI